MSSPQRKPSSDYPTENSLWRPVWKLLNTIDQQIAALYEEANLAEVRPRYVGPLIRLGRHAPMTIRELADAMSMTHSALSQTISAMQKDGLVESLPGEDARTKQVQLTEKAKAVLPFLEAEWRATEAVLHEIEQEIPYPLTRVVRDIEQVLGRHSFRDRLRQHLPDTEGER